MTNPRAVIGGNNSPSADRLVIEKRGRGRPSLYSPEVVERLCGRLANAESLRSICRDSGMPGLRTVLGWVVTKPEFRRQYDLAREIGRQTIGGRAGDLR